MNHDEFRKYISGFERPVILLEGTRALPAKDRHRLAALGEKLARECPEARFRTGNAPGSDEAFARGVRKVDPSRLEYVLPYSGHRPGKPGSPSRRVAVTEIPVVADQRAAYQSCLSSPQYSAMLRKRRLNRRLEFISLYIIRDTLKVIGAAESGLAPATIGIFYARRDDPMKGGTGHTIRVCRRHGVPALLQDDWLKWTG